MIELCGTHEPSALQKTVQSPGHSPETTRQSAVGEYADGFLPSTRQLPTGRSPAEPIQTSPSQVRGEGFLYERETTTKAGARTLCGSQVGLQRQPLPAPGYHLCEIQLQGTGQPSLCNLQCLGASGTAGSPGVQTAPCHRLLTKGTLG